MDPVEISNVRVVRTTFADQLANIDAPENANLKRCLEYISYIAPGETYLPLLPKFRVDFTLSGTCSGFANGLRRCMMDEIPIYSMDMGDVDTNDPYVISDVVQKNVDLIPIIQDAYELEEMQKWNISLDVLNITDEIMFVNSGSLTITAGGKKIPTDSVMSPNIIIAELRPATYLKSSGIGIVVGTAHEDAAKFATVSNTRYLIGNGELPAASSLMENPSVFQLGYTTYRNLNNPKIIMLRVCKSLEDRLAAFGKELASAVIPHFSTLMDIEAKGEYVMVNFKNETWTLVNMVAQYCYALDPEIPFVAPAIIHPSTSVGVVKIKHPNALNIVRDSIQYLLIDVDCVRRAFGSD